MFARPACRIGDPDIPTPAHILEVLTRESWVPANHRYPESDGLLEFRQAIAEWYLGRFELKLNPNDEVLPLLGAKEGIGHMAMCLLDPGDVALIPDPGYPVYSVGAMFAGATIHTLPLLEENGWMPNLRVIPEEIASKAKVMWINYPNNPTGGLATENFFSEVVAFAEQHNVAICHDAAYSEVTFDGYRAPSFLQTPGAMNVGIEFHSLSKTYNMTGWRIGMAVGNAQLIDALLRVKSNLDSGIPQAIQQMGIEALRRTSSTWIETNNNVYQNRRDSMVATLRKIGLQVTIPKAGLYVWAKVPEGWTSTALATELLESHSVVVTPGRSYGEYGEGYIRLSLTTPDERVEEGLGRLANWQIPSVPPNS